MKYWIILLTGILISMTACVLSPRKPLPKPKPVSLSDVHPMQTTVARKKFRDVFLKYLADKTIWPDDMFGLKELTVSAAQFIRSSDFVGAQQPQQDQVLFLYKQDLPLLPDADFSFMAFSTQPGAHAHAIYQVIPGQGGSYYLAITNTSVCIAYNLTQQPVVEGSFWSISWNNKTEVAPLCFDNNHGNKVVDFGVGRAFFPSKYKNAAVFPFSSKQKMNDFASILFGAFPDIKYGVKK